MIVVVGLSHHTAAIAVREQVALSEEAASSLAGRLAADASVAEVFIVSTCNRVEIVAASIDDEAESVERCVNICRQLVVERCPEADSCLYSHQGKEAVRHLVRVAASLDSLVVGEAQILGQLKQGFERSRVGEHIGPILHQLFVSATRGAKRVRSETSIGVGQVSVPSIAVELASQIFDDLKGRHAVLIGNGEMGQTVARLLADAGAELTVVGRNLERVSAVVERVGGTAHLLEDLPALLVSADIVVSSTSASSHVLTEKELKLRSKSRRARNLFIIDLAVPRDVDPKVGQLDGTFLYDVDDLSQVASQSSTARKNQADAAHVIVEQVVSDWERRVQVRQVAPTIKALRAKMRMGFEAELQKSLKGKLRDLDTDQRLALAKMLDAGIGRILHEPITRLRQEASRMEQEPLESSDDSAGFLSELFGLSDVAAEALEVPSVRIPSPANASLAELSLTRTSRMSERSAMDENDTPHIK